jgi:sugar lactone lactonase YvrE
MQYILTLYVNEHGWPKLTKAEQEQGMAAYMAYTEALRKTGVLKGVGRLQPSSTATTVRIVDGKSQVLDGPFVDSKEQMGGYYLIDVPDLDAAISWAARCPAAGHGVVEVRPLWGTPPLPEVQTLRTGIAFGESPRWHDGRLWFSDWGAQEIIAVDPEGKSEVIVRVPFPSIPMCIDFLPDGRLLIVSTHERLLLRREGDGSLVTHADLRGLSGVGFNEIVVDGPGNAYVNSAGFDLLAGEKFAPGFVALVSPDGSVRQVADGMAFPNGMIVTPDNSTLIVAESYGKRLTAFDIATDGSLSNRRVWADLGEGVPDGICLDAENAIWYGDVPNKRCVRVREGGEVLQTIDLDRGCFACALGGADMRTLYMVATEWRGPAHMTDGPRTGQILTVEVLCPGVSREQIRSLA